MSLLTGDPKDAETPPPGSPPPGNPPTDWRSGLPEDIRQEKVFEAIKGKDWAEAGPLLAKNYVHAQKLVGAEKLIIPDDKATPEEWSKFYGKLGRPETPDKYTYKLPEGVKPEQLNKSVVDNWLKELHEAGIPAKQADRIISKYLSDEMATRKASTDARDKMHQGWELSLKQELGAKYDERVNYAKWALKEFGDKDGALVKMLDESKLGSHPAIVKFFAEVGARMADDKARGAGGGPRFNQSPNNPAEAQAALNVFNHDESKQKALWDTQHPRHADAVKERESLFKAAFPKDE